MRIKKMFAVLSATAIMITLSAVPALASVTDSTLPTRFIAYTAYANTDTRTKDNDTSVYMNNTSGMTLWVYTNGGTAPSGTTGIDVGTTIGGYANVNPGEYKIRNYIQEYGYTTAFCNISTATNGVGGTLSGKWSPDSVGNFPNAN